MCEFLFVNLVQEQILHFVVVQYDSSSQLYVLMLSLTTYSANLPALAGAVLSTRQHHQLRPRHRP